MLKEHLLSTQSSPTWVLEYVSSFRERLHKACETTKTHLSSVQSKMKAHFDKKSVTCHFEIGAKVVVLLPVPGSALQAKFFGPYTVDKKLSETDYEICTPDRRRQTRVCHINMMKPYILRDGGEATDLKVVPVMSAVLPPVYSPENDGLFGCEAMFSGGNLKNSAILSDLDTYLSYLPVQQRGEVGKLIREYPTLFSDIPSQTNVLVHDIDVGENLPIKQFLYRVNPAKVEIMRAEVQYLLQNGLAKPSENP